MQNSRTDNAKRNIVSGVINKFIMLFMPFASRTVLIWVLGAEYLGLGSLFSSILQVLSMAELGFSSAVVFSLYEPIAQKDRDTIRALLNYYRKMYRIVGMVILIGGTIVLPFLPRLIHDDVPPGINLYVLYTIYLLNTVVSYFAYAYKSSLIIADQRQDIINYINLIICVIQCILQIVVLLVFKNYYLFAAVLIIFSILNNIIVAAVTSKRYPEFYCEGELSVEARERITKQIKGLAIGKFAKTARNSFDSIVLSIFCGLIEVAIYSNYYYVFTAVIGFITIILTSISAGVGNSIAVESIEKNYSDFKRFHFYISWIGSWSTICLFCLYQPFMEIWVGKKLMASNSVMLLFCVYFYITQIGQMRAVYAGAAGLWWEFRWLEIGEMVANLLLNFLLGYYWGMRGILLATIITVLLFSVIGITNLTYRYYFMRKSTEYHRINTVYATVTIIVGLLTSFLCRMVHSENKYLHIFICGIICVVLPNMIFFLLCMNNSTCKEYIYILRKTIRRA